MEVYRQAIMIDPTNPLARMKRAKRFAQALAAYTQSYKVSGGQPYPLLNALKLQVQVKESRALSGSDKLALARAQRIREGQSQETPPFDKPSRFFDLAEIKLRPPSLSVMWP
jgi:hypothetical protein